MSSPSDATSVNPKTDAQREEMIEGFLSDIKAIENRIASDLILVVQKANGIIDLSSQEFITLKSSLMNARFTEPEPGMPAQSVTSFAETSNTILEKLDKKSNRFSQSEKDRITQYLADRKNTLDDSLSTESNVKPFMVESLKQTAISNLTLANSDGHFYNTPSERSPTESMIAKNISFPLEILRLLPKDSPQFAATTLKNIIQGQIAEVFDPKKQDKTKLRIYKIYPDKLSTPAIQKQLADKINHAITEFTREGLSTQIIQGLQPPISPEQQPAATTKFAKLAAEAKIPLSTLADPEFQKAISTLISNGKKIDAKNLKIASVAYANRPALTAPTSAPIPQPHEAEKHNNASLSADNPSISTQSKATKADLDFFSRNLAGHMDLVTSREKVKLVQNIMQEVTDNVNKKRSKYRFIDDEISNFTLQLECSNLSVTDLSDKKLKKIIIKQIVKAITSNDTTKILTINAGAVNSARKGNRIKVQPAENPVPFKEETTPAQEKGADQQPAKPSYSTILAAKAIIAAKKAKAFCTPQKNKIAPLPQQNHTLQPLGNGHG